MPILDSYGRPVDTSRRMARASRDAGSLRGAFAGWQSPRVFSEGGAASERILGQRRFADLAVNNWCAESALSAITQSSIGTGIRPSAQIPADRLGISPEQARELGKSLEWLWAEWEKAADVTGGMSFADLQMLALRSLLSMGEIVHLPVMLAEDERSAAGLKFSLAIQPVSPMRLQTPSIYAADPAVKDGIRFSPSGRPLEYYIATPAAVAGETLTELDNSAAFTPVRARRGSRPGILHLFVRTQDEQIRGISVFSNSAGLFQLLNDSLSYELLAQVMASKFPVFISRDAAQNAFLPEGVYEDTGPDAERHRYTDLDGPQIMYGDPGEKPEVLKNERPSSNFLNFVRTVLNAISSSVGIPYIALAKDFESVNYSSARAAMNEAWRVYRWYRQFFAVRYCQPIWEMFVEEAFLRGYIRLPQGAPDFYAAREFYTAAAWHGPARGYMDPIKEVQADVLALENHLVTRREIMAAAGRDFDDEYPVLLAEAELMQALAASSAEPAAAGGGVVTPGAAPLSGNEKPENNTEEGNDEQP